MRKWRNGGREKKKPNLMFNIDEKEDASRQDRIKNELDTCKQVIREVGVDVEEEDIVQVQTNIKQCNREY